jgi:hypothetical protein
VNLRDGGVVNLSDVSLVDERPRPSRFGRNEKSVASPASILSRATGSSGRSSTASVFEPDCCRRRNSSTSETFSPGIAASFM